LLDLLSKARSALTPNEAFVFRIALAVSAVAGFFVFLDAYYAATEEAPKKGGIFTEGIVGQPIFINPLISSGSDADSATIELIFPDLGSVMDSYTTSTDRKTASITLKKEISWDDGAPLTADDVIFTVETAQDILIRAPQSGAWQGIIAEKINENEVRFTLKEPMLSFEETMRKLKIAPRHIFGAVPAANLRLSAYNLEPVGAGPWKFAGIETKRSGFITEIRLTPNPRYAGKEPFLSEFSLRFYPDAESAIVAFNKKEIDGLGGLSAEDATSLPIEHRLISSSLPRYYAAFLNQNTHPALKDRAVRAALSAAIDRKKIAREAFHDYAAASVGPIPPQTKGYDPKPYTGQAEGLAEAQRLLDAAGWLINPEDGIRYKTIKGERARLEFSLAVPDLPPLLKTAELIANDWKASGIKANITPASIEDLQKGPIRTRNYEIIIFGNILKGNPDIYAFWHSSQKFYPGLNLAMYDNKDADTILTSIRGSETPDPRQITKLEEIISNDAPAVFLINPNYLYALPANLRGEIDDLTTPADRLKNTESWHIRTARKLKKST
jgi:peptide/nickel transport system substrate-binding protein